MLQPLSTGAFSAAFHLAPGSPCGGARNAQVGAGAESEVVAEAQRCCRRGRRELHLLRKGVDPNTGKAARGLAGQDALSTEMTTASGRL